MTKQLKGQTFVGVVEDNNDPEKLGRCKVRVLNIYDEIPANDLPWAKPWKDLGGNQFNAPDVGKIVTVVFDTDNMYKPEFIYSDHFNVNLERKLETLSGEDYTSMKAIYFDHSTQIYRNNSEGLKIDHEYTNFNLDSYGNILLNLRDNKSIITLGSKDAEEEAILGTTFMEWFDGFLEILSGLGGGAFLDSSGAPVVATPGFVEILGKYINGRPDFLSKHVRLPQNNAIIPQSRPYNNQSGDSWDSTTDPNNLTSTGSGGYIPSSDGYQPLSEATPDNPANYKPSDLRAAVQYDVPTSSLDTSKYRNGYLPDGVLQPSQWASGTKRGQWVTTAIGGDAAKFAKEAAVSFDALFDLYERSNFPGKNKIKIEAGYRTYASQVATKAKFGDSAATPGTSNHGWGLAVDIGGICSSSMPFRNNKSERYVGFRTPVYQWFFENSWQFGIYNPEGMRDGKGNVEEWWHWEFHGPKGPPKPQQPLYAVPFTRKDLLILQKNKIETPNESTLKSYFTAYPDRNV